MGLLTRATASWHAQLVAVLLSLLLGAALLELVFSERSSGPVGVRVGSSYGGLSSVPLASQAPISAALRGDDSAFGVSGVVADFQAANPTLHLVARFGRSG